MCDSSRAPVLEVRFFVTESGREPVRVWLRGLAHHDRREIGRDIKTAQYGWPLGMPLVRKIDPGLWEVRSHLSRGIGRVLFTVEDSTMLLLHGFVKKSPKTPLTDLETARRRLAQLRRG
jgi:phage-related protein